MVSGEQKLMSSQITVGVEGSLSLQTKIKPKSVRGRCLELLPEAGSCIHAVPS